MPKTRCCHRENGRHFRGSSLPRRSLPLALRSAQSPCDAIGTRKGRESKPMKSALLDERDGLRTFAVVLGTGDEAMGALTEFAVKQHLRGRHFTAIGAFSRVVVAYFDWPSKAYRNLRIDSQRRDLASVSDICVMQDHPKVD